MLPFNSKNSRFISKMLDSAKYGYNFSWKDFCRIFISENHNDRNDGIMFRMELVPERAINVVPHSMPFYSIF